MDLRVARLAQAHQVAGLVCAALRNRKNMMNFLDWCQPAFLEALLTQGVRRCVPVTDALPSPTVFAVDVRAALVLVVTVPVQLLMLRTEASISKPWTAGVSAGLLWAPWHIITSLSGHNKSPAGKGLPQGFRRFYFVHHNTIIRGDSQSLSFTLMMAATQASAVSCIRYMCWML